MQRDQFEQWYKLANFYDPGPDCLAVVSSTEHIRAEWRFVIAGKRVVTGSQYRIDGMDMVAPNCPPEAAAFADSVANATPFDPHPIYVMDVAQTDDGFRLIEIGSVCCASLYACNLGKIVDAVVDMAAKTVDR